MRILNDTEEVARVAPRVVFAAGFFDGVHLGHRSILKRTVELARLSDAAAWVLTFDPHPMRVLDSYHCPPLLTGLASRLELLAETGADGCLLIPFTTELAELGPDEFCAKVFGRWFISDKSCVVVAGENWRFGKARSGRLQDITRIFGGRIATDMVAPVVLDGAAVSSSRVRCAIKSGDLELANRLLGYNYRIRGKTLRGRGVGGIIGFATANIVPDAEVMPPVGVYEVLAEIPARCGEKKFRALANLGFRPTFPDSSPASPELEVHIPGFSGDLHDEELQIAFIRRIREERKFSGPEELRAQVARDIACISESPA